MSEIFDLFILLIGDIFQLIIFLEIAFVLVEINFLFLLLALLGTGI